jgi:aspartyl/asparaginyl beta-hydroxylase (cupin superfamily)
MKKNWYSLFDRNLYIVIEPNFYDTSKLGFTELIESNFEVIKLEFTNFLAKKNLESYFNTTMVNKHGTWKTISLKWWNIQLYENHKYFPKTLAIFEQIPGFVSLSFNLLEAGGHIVPHNGDTNAIYRCHLGIKIPDTIPNCGFRVEDEWRSWEEGKLLVFVDALNHEAINFSNSPRFIMLFDIVREEYLYKKKRICATVMTSLFMQKRAEKFKLAYRLPIKLQVIIAKILIPFAYMAIPIRNLIYRYKK